MFLRSIRFLTLVATWLLTTWLLTTWLLTTDSMVLGQDSRLGGIARDQPGFLERIDADTTVANSSWLPSSLANRYRTWESILSQPDRSLPADQEIKVLEVVDYLNRIGVPTVVDQSAKDDELENDAILRLPLPRNSIMDRLLVALAERNATLSYERDHLTIISRDVADSPEYFVQVNYDVTRYVGRKANYVDSRMVMGAITQAINPDAWSTSQGEQTLVPYFQGDQTILVVSANLDTHWKIREMLSGLNKLTKSDSSSIPIGPTLSSRYETGVLPLAGLSQGSTPVELPERRPRAGITLPGSNSSGNFGGGGLGGAFAIPDSRGSSPCIPLPSGR